MLYQINVPGNQECKHNSTSSSILQKKITWDGKGINGWGCHLQLKSESLSVGTKTKLYIEGVTYLFLEASSD